MRDFKDPYYSDEPCKCCNPKPEDVDARIDALLERLEILGTSLSVIREHIDAVGDKLERLKTELDSD